MLFGIEENGNVHKYTENLKLQNKVDVFNAIGDISKLNEFGLSYTYAGKEQFKYEELYKLGMGSYDGINTNTYTLTINYETLKSKLYNKDFNGIYAESWQESETTNNGYTSTCQSELLINYTDGSTKNIYTDKTSANNRKVDENKNTYIIFDKTKSIDNIKIIIHEYDSDCGHSYGAITAINLF